MRDMIRLGQVDPVRRRVADATQALLGDTIVLSDEEWRGTSRLPGWTRAKVASHIARSADAMRAVVLATVDGRPRPKLYPSESRRLADLEFGADRSGLDLQIDLDTSAEALEAAFSQVVDWLVVVPLPVGELPLSALPLARLHEVFMHHIDLDTGYTKESLDPVAASWLLQWAALWLRTKPGLPAVQIQSVSGVVEQIGDVGERRLVSGPDLELWSWLTGRCPIPNLEGAEGIEWPLLG